MTSRFNLGSIVATVGVSEVFTQHELLECLDKHHACDWAESVEADRKLNDLAVESGERIMSTHRPKLPESLRALWIITEADRSVTTLLLPSEY